MYRSRLAFASLILILAAAPAAADELAADQQGDAGKLGLGVQAGLVLPQLQSELGTTYGLHAHAGYRVLSHLTVFAGLGYNQPSVKSELGDPRVDGDYMTTTDQLELTFTLGALWRFLPPSSRLNFYGGAGLRSWYLSTKTNGNAGGEEFLQNQETSTRVGAAVLGGAEYRAGPGVGVAELDVGGSDLPHLITGDVATTAVSLMVGYRLFL